MKHPDDCPHCNALLDEGDVLEVLQREHPNWSRIDSLLHAASFGWAIDDQIRFSRIVGVYDRELDRTTHYECPDCEEKI
jgi:hypothetical protein